MTARNEYQRQQARAAAAKPLENVKPAIGMQVRLTDHKGLWSIVGRAPHGAEWWLTPADQEARDQPKLPAPLGSYRSADYRTMRPHNFKGEK